MEKERQRIAEQAKRELDDARRQVAEARRQAEDAALQVEQAKKQAALDAQQQIEAARREQEQRERERQATLAALTPPAAPAPASVVVPAMDPADIARLLQAHLKRVGCDPGTTDGAWTAPSQKALDNFNRNAGTRFDVKVASLDALDAVRGRPDRVCPLVCAKGQKAEGDRCVQIVCDGNDVLDAQSTCRRRPDPPPQKPKAVSRQEPSPRGRARPSGGADSCGGSCEGD
ncbi:type II secretory pathway pseudopilin PulG [Bradyrhizobium sp. GM2.2]